MITSETGNVLSNNLYDAFGVLMVASGSAATQWRFEGRFVEEEGLVAAAGGGGDVLVARGGALSAAMASKVPNCSNMSPGACFVCLTRMGVPCDKAKAQCGAHVVCPPPPGPHGCGFWESVQCAIMCGTRGVTMCIVSAEGIMDCTCGDGGDGGPDIDDPDGGPPGGDD